VTIAGVIGVGLEIYSTKFLIERVAEDLTEKLVGRGLPPKLQSHIRDITKTSIVREKLIKAYSFGEPQGGRVNLDIEITFEARNFSDSVEEFAPELQEETVYSPVFLYLEYGIVGETPHVFDASSLQGISRTDPITRVRSFRGASKVQLKPTSRSTDVCQVRWHYSVTMADEYSEITSFAGATIGATIVLRDIHPSLDFQCSGESLTHVEGSRTWYFDRPFVREQHVRVWWVKKEPVAQILK
jgi:hypothetical protein